METQTLAILYALVFIGIEIIWLVTIRDRSALLIISCATILVGVEGVSIIIVRDRFWMGNQYVLGRIFKFSLIDILVLSVLWIFIFGFPKHKGEETQAPDLAKNTRILLSALEHVLGSADPNFKITLLLISFAIAIINVPFGIFGIFVPIFWPLLLTFPRYLIDSPLFQHLPHNLVRAIGYSDVSLLVGWILYGLLIVPMLLTKKAFWIVLYLMFIFLLINNVAGCQKSLDVSW